MKLNSKNQVFNFFNTNGRRADVIEAYTIYLDILSTLQVGKKTEWSSFPKSLTQYNFYQKAIQSSPQVFRQTGINTTFNEHLTGNYKKAFENLDKPEFERLPNGKNLLSQLDESIEARSRHYTSNLVKIGFTNSKREISKVGFAYLYPEDLVRTDFEKILSIDNVNLILLRQLMKVKIFSTDFTYSYSPFWMAILLLIQEQNYTINDFVGIIQTLTPNYPVKISDLMKKIEENGLSNTLMNYIDFSDDPVFQELSTKKTKLSQSVFKSLYKNRKSSKVADEKYYEFYNSLYDFNVNRSRENLEKLYATSFINPKTRNIINKAFNFGNSVFNFITEAYRTTGNTSELNEFLELNNDNDLLDLDNFNFNFYNRYTRSKRYDQVQENGDTLRRIIEATGIITIKSGMISLKNPYIWETIFENINLEKHIFEEVNVNDFNSYSEIDGAYLLTSHTINQILNELAPINMENVISKILKEVGAQDITEAHHVLHNQLNKDFLNHIHTVYPLDSLREILLMFSDRSNDRKIQRLTNSSASIPTIFEYIVGIAWYYMRDEEYDVIASFNMSMTGDFEPIRFAGGGYGDIICRYTKETVMLEVTLMDANTQKRGELEPVSRHTVNLTIDEHPTPVYTIFIASELDNNTINNWRAQSYYPQEGTLRHLSNRTTEEGIKIFPMTIDELDKLIEEGVTVSGVTKQLKSSIKFDRNNREWRTTLYNRILSKID